MPLEQIKLKIREYLFDAALMLVALWDWMIDAERAINTLILIVTLITAIIRLIKEVNYRKEEIRKQKEEREKTYS